MWTIELGFQGCDASNIFFLYIVLEIVKEFSCRCEPITTKRFWEERKRNMTGINETRTI